MAQQEKQPNQELAQNQKLIQSLQQEVKQLEDRKVFLLDEIEQLELQKQQIIENTKLTAKPQPQKKFLVKLGFLLAFLSTLCLSCQNIVIATILSPSSLFGKLTTGGYITPTVESSLLILWFRMLMVVPLLFVISRFIYPPSWGVIKKIIDCQDSGLTIKVLASGFFLFLSQILIYLSLGFLPVGTAVTIFFIFPVATILLAWFLFRERPNLVRTIVMVIAGLGILLTIVLSSDSSWFGVNTAICSGITFAIYIVLTQLCGRKLHPVPFSVLNFITILICSFLGLLIILPFNAQFSIEPEVWIKLIISGLLLGILTLLSYLFSNISIRFIGAGNSAIMGGINPGLTACLGWFVLGQSLGYEVGGIVLSTLGIIGISLERIYNRL